MPHRLAIGLAVLVLAVSLAATPAAAATATSPVYDAEGRLIETPFVPAPPDPVLDEQRALAIALAYPKVGKWVDRYPADGLTKAAAFDEDDVLWNVKVWSDLPDAGQIVYAKVDDATGRVLAAWTGPQVAWSMARGTKGLFGRTLNEAWVWWPFCAVFLLGLADLRRLRSLRNLDLLALVSFSASLWFFNHGEIFTSVPLAYPPLLYLLVRMTWIGVRGRQPSSSRPLWPIWVLVAATIFLAGFRIAFNLTDSTTIDVGYAGVVGAQRIVSEGEVPYGHMPVRRGKECGKPNSEGRVDDFVQRNGRCEHAIERGDTYGPVTYLVYIPGYLAKGWDGDWTGATGSLPAAHFTTLLVDGLALIGLALVGRRFGGARLAATLPFAWAAYPFTQYVSMSNSNDAILPVLLIFGFWLLTSAPARGLFVGLASWAKFASLLLLPLWASYNWAPTTPRNGIPPPHPRRDHPPGSPTGLRRPRAVITFAVGFVLATALAFWVLLLEPDPLSAGRTFWSRTIGWQLGRDSPFSIWNWDEYPGYPDLSMLQLALEIVVGIGALAAGLRPRRKSPRQLAALSAALLIAFELVLTHWFYLYIPWFFPFVVLALLLPARRAEDSGEHSDDRPVRELAAASA